VSETTKKRPWLAALLALLVSGLGHVYLREWLRSLVWFSLYLVSFEVLVPDEVMPAEPTIAAYQEMAQALPLDAALALSSIVIFGMLDAYWLAKRTHREAEVEAGETCPHCGKDVDEDLAFCHWCTNPLPGSEEFEAEVEDDPGAS
jgi:hypothetical protein